MDNFQLIDQIDAGVIIEHNGSMDFSTGVTRDTQKKVSQHCLSPYEAFLSIESAWNNIDQAIHGYGISSKAYIKAKQIYLERIEAFIEVHYVNAQFFRKDEPHIITRLKNLRNKIQSISNNHLGYEIRDLEKYGISPQFLPRPIGRESDYGTFIVEFPNK